MATGIGIRGAQIEYGEATVTLDGSGNGTVAITFEQAFVTVPAILVVPEEADALAGATYQVATSPAATKSGFTLQLVSSRKVSRDTKVKWFAHQKD